MSIRRSPTLALRPPFPPSKTHPGSFYSLLVDGRDATRRDCHIQRGCSGRGPPRRCYSRFVRSAFRFAASDSRLLVRKHLRLYPLNPTVSFPLSFTSFRFVSRLVCCSPRSRIGVSNSLHSWLSILLFHFVLFQ